MICSVRHFENEIPLTFYHGREMSTISGNVHHSVAGSGGGGVGCGGGVEILLAAQCNGNRDKFR